MMNTLKALVAGAVCTGACWLLYQPDTTLISDETYRFNYQKEAEEEALKHRLKPDAWEHTAHGGDLGFPWQAAQAETFAKFRDQYHNGGATDRSAGYGPFLADWIEKGPSKIPGRVTASEVLHDQNRIYLMTDGGYLFRSNSLTGNDWQCLNDHYPLTRDVSARLEVLPRPDGTNRIIVGGWDEQNMSAKFLKYSDDEGQTWQIPNGLPNSSWYRRTFATNDGQVWHLVNTSATGSGPKMQIYRSTNYGTDFTLHYSFNLTAGYYDRRCDMWKPIDSDTIFAVFEDKLFKISPDGTAQNVGLVSQKPNPEWVALTGGRADASQPYTLYFRIWDNGENNVYRSTDSGASWAQWATLADGLHTPFSLYSFVTNPEDPSKLYSAGWIVGETEDGVTWHNPHDLGGYVGYHGDVPDMNFVKNPATNAYEFYIGTDGGYYKYNPANDQFTSLSLQTLNNTQIYKMASDHQVEHRMYIGTQDNGFNYNLTATAATGIAPFSYLWGGDVTQVTSGDGGKSFFCFWIGSGCNYVKNAAQMQNSGIANWGPINDSGYWETPAKADPLAPDECLVGGHKPPSTEGSYLIRLKAPADLQNGQLKPLETEFGDYDFQAASGGGRIGAIAISPLDNHHLYVMTENGVFFWSLDKGLTWQKNESAKNKIFPRYIAVSPVNAGEVFVGGAGYGTNAPAWKTSNHGQTFVRAENPLNSVLNNNRVNAVCFDPEGKYVFAAADIGAFVYVIAEGKWQVISGSPSPMSHFHDVEFLENSNTVRFATYARGVWDFHINGLVSGTSETVQGPGVKVYPNPTTDYIIVEPGNAQSLTITDATGRVQYRTRCAGTSLRIPMAQWPVGTYYITLDNGAVKKVVKSGK